MRKQPWIVVSVMLAAAAPWACSHTVEELTTGSGTGGGSASHVSASHSSGPVTSTGTGGLDCTGILMAGPCDDCLQASCCQVYSDCANDANCFNCVFGGSTDATCMDPATTAISDPFVMCAQGSCKNQC